LQEVKSTRNKFVFLAILVSSVVIFYLVYYFFLTPTRTAVPPDVGKNWTTSGVVKAKGKPEPKRNLKDTSDPTEDRKLLQQRFKKN
jgi:hypothetical protein